MDIGTAKPTATERAAVPHHLVDVADPSEDWSVARHPDVGPRRDRRHRGTGPPGAARGRYRLVRARSGRRPRAPRRRPRRARAALLVETESPDGVARAYDRLRSVDPVAAARIEPNNRRRIVRALEVFDATGRRFSSFGAGFDTYGSPTIDARMVGIWIGRPALNDRIEARFSAMRDGGLLDEVRTLVVNRTSLSRTAAQAIGYRETLAFLRGEQPSVDAAFTEAVHRTRRFARRQRMWFRRDPRVEWIATGGNPQELAPRSWQPGRDPFPHRCDHLDVPVQAPRHRQRLPRPPRARRVGRRARRARGRCALRPAPRHRCRRAHHDRGRNRRRGLHDDPRERRRRGGGDERQRHPLPRVGRGARGSGS